MNSTSPQQNEATLHAVDYWQVIKNRYGIILLTLLLVFMTAAVITYVMPRKFESMALIEVKPRSTAIVPFGNDVSYSTSSSMTPQFFGTEFEKIRSSNSLGKVVDNLELTNKWGMDKEQIIQILKGIVVTNNQRGTDLITIRVRHGNKQDARDITAEVAKAYEVYRTEVDEKDTRRGLDELDKAVREQGDKVVEDRKALVSMSRLKKIVPQSKGSYSHDVADYESSAANQAIIAYNNEIQSKIMLEGNINCLLKYTSDQLLLFASGLDLPDNIIRNLYPQYLERTRELGKLESELGDRHPDIISANREIATMKRQLDDGVVSLRAALQAKLQFANETLKGMELEKNKTSDNVLSKSIDSQEYHSIEEIYNSDKELYESMKLRKITADIKNKMTDIPIVVHEEPQIAKFPCSPNVTLNMVLGAVLGLVLGVVIAFFLEYLDTSVKSLEDVERYLQVPVLAVIPKDVGVLHKQSGMSPDAEAYRILRTNIEFNRKNPEDNAITVVSGGAGEGKSTTLVNLAYICAQGGYTTLMIDADLRRPRLHTFFDINNSVGLTNYLTTELMLEDVILQTPVDNLYFMPSGILPADAAGILNSRRMSELIQDVKQRFDLVLVDSPPILGVSDASVLASEVDLTMIVVQHRKLPRNMLLRVKQAVENVGGNVIGVVLNNVDVRSDSQYQYYTSYYTYYAPAESQIGPPVGSGSITAAKPQASPARGNDNELY